MKESYMLLNYSQKRRSEWNYPYEVGTFGETKSVCCIKSS